MCRFEMCIFDASLFGQVRTRGNLTRQQLTKTLKCKLPAATSCHYTSQVEICLPTKMEQGNNVIPWSHISCVKLFLPWKRLNFWYFFRLLILGWLLGARISFQAYGYGQGISSCLIHLPTLWQGCLQAHRVQLLAHCPHHPWRNQGSVEHEDIAIKK